MPEIPARQKEALAYPVKVPMMYTNVLLKQVDRVSKARRVAHQRAGHVPPASFLDPGSTVGGYQGVSTPGGADHFSLVARVPTNPAFRARSKIVTGSKSCSSMTFAHSN